MSKTPHADDWVVIDHANDNERTFDNRGDAEEAVEAVEDLGGDPEMFPPGQTPDDDSDSAPEEPCAICGDPVSIAEAKSGPGRQPVHPECPPDSRPDESTEPEVVEQVEPEPEMEPDADELPERSVSDDPLSWMPGHFIDEIDGTPAINRKGFEVLAHHYDISTTADLEVPPEEADHEYVRVKARAETEDGRVAEAYGSAHVDRGDDPELLLEMADTRARKRALSIATGVGVVAVAEMKNEVER